MSDQQWGPPTGPYPPQGTAGGHHSPPGPGLQQYPQQLPYQPAFPGGYQQPPQGYPQPGYPPQNPGFGWGPQFGGGPGMPQPPMRRPPKPPRRTGLIVSLVVLGAVLGVGVAVAAGLAASGDVSVGVPSPVKTSPVLPTPDPTMSEPPPTNEPTVAPTTTKPTTTRPTAPPPKPRKRVPPPPNDNQIVTRDRFYATGSMASVGCQLNGRPSSKAGISVYYNTLFRCLNTAWAPKLRRGGDPFRAPRVLLIAGPVSSPCGGGFSNVSYYCGRNEVIYMRYDMDVKNYNRWPQNYQKVWAKMWAMHTVAHEYGHHVQQLSGVLTASWNRSWAMANESERLQESRRRELQASCLGNLFIGANRRALPITGENNRQYRWAISHTIDPRRDHGAPTNHNFWALRGYNGRNPGLCNTYTASSRAVG
ncbi:MAG TPA: neutral zinc metallopeptidase [Kribbellaceae bacterium]|nr:neutral zinc metallopeptidase [Kribbellaceae bacterium]